MNDECIMKPNDYIAAADVNELTADQWQQFRAYIRSCGYQVADDYGHHRPSFGNGRYVALDCDGDLSWFGDPPEEEGTQVKYEQIIQAIDQMNPTISRHQILNDINNQIKQHEAEITALRQRYLEATKRQTGRSTAIALRTIAEALNKPNCNQFFVDHDNNSQNNFRLALTIEEIIDKLGLSDLYVNSDKTFVRYSQFGQQAK